MDSTALGGEEGTLRRSVLSVGHRVSVELSSQSQARWEMRSIVLGGEDRILRRGVPSFGHCASTNLDFES